jgi:PPOX class probable F420-dependent enzyme
VSAVVENGGQRRGRAIAMTQPEVEDFLTAERTCRVATVGGDGRPHVAPLWFVWDDEALWLNSLVRSQRWTDLARDPRVAVVVDAGTEFSELRGVEITGRALPVGEVPRSGAADAELAAPERAFARKYGGTETVVPDGRHAWLRITPERLVSCDFRKSAALRPAAGGGAAS